VTSSKPRLVTRLSRPIDRRLRMTAAVAGPGMHLTDVLETALEKGLPTDDELAEIMRNGGTLDDYFAS
jgi:hypothetical protein